MKLGDLDVDILVQALQEEQAEWLDVRGPDRAGLTEADRATICVLHALHRALAKAARVQASPEEKIRRGVGEAVVKLIDEANPAND
jgi:hypothetical protein